MWIAFHNPFKLAFARRAKAINLKQSNPKGELRAFLAGGGGGTNPTRWGGAVCCKTYAEDAIQKRGDWRGEFALGLFLDGSWTLWTVHF